MKPLILTVTGRRINPLFLKTEDVCKEDVAHHLSAINRFTGATRIPISVAQHAVCVSRLLDKTGLEEQGLHHDDSEAYLNDVSKWLKATPEMEGYRQAETRAQISCYQAFQIPTEQYANYKHLMHPLVEEADRLMLRYEAYFGFGEKIWYSWLQEMNNPLYTELTKEEIEKVSAVCPKKPWKWNIAKEAYLTRIRELEYRKT